MQYMLMLYVNEAGWTKLTPAEQEQGVAAYMAYTEALKKAGVLRGQQPPAAELGGDDRARRQRQVAGARRSVRGLEGAARRLLPDRRAPISTPRSPGPRAARPRVTASSRCARSGTAGVSRACA